VYGQTTALFEEHCLEIHSTSIQFPFCNKVVQSIGKSVNWVGLFGGQHGRGHRRTGRHFTGGAEKICPENSNLPFALKITFCPETNILV